MSADEPLFMELDPSPAVAVPPGYRAYLVRDWDWFIIAQAEAVRIREDATNELFFDYGSGGILEARRPRYPGELSHLFLPAAYDVPFDVARLRAQPVPAVVAPQKPRRNIVFRFREEPLPPGAPPGSKAYRGEFETFVITGLVTGITGRNTGGFVFTAGSDVRIRKSRPGSPDNVSHILVPAGSSLPPEFIER